MNILELLEGVIRKPADTFKVIAEGKPVGWALVIFTAVAVLGSLTADYSAIEQIIEVTPPNIILLVAGSLVGLLLTTGLLYLVSRLFKGPGDYWGLFSALGFARFPGFLTPIAESIKRIGGIGGSVLGNVITVGAGIWVLVLWVIALRESREITTGESILTYVIVFFGFLALPLIVAVWIYSVLG